MVGKIVIGKQGIKDRLGYQMLCQHFNDFIVGNTVIQIITQFIGKCPEGTDFYLITRIFENAVNTVDMCAGNFSNIVRPVFPVMPVTAFFNDFYRMGGEEFLLVSQNPDAHYLFSFIKSIRLS